MARRVKRGQGPLHSATANLAVPTLSGTATLGQVLTCSEGEWSGWPRPTLAYQWVRGASTDIAGATAATRTVAAADQTTTLKCRVTATNPGATAAATSAPTGTIP